MPRSMTFDHDIFPTSRRSAAHTISDMDYRLVASMTIRRYGPTYRVHVKGQTPAGSRTENYTAELEGYEVHDVFGDLPPSVRRMLDTGSELVCSFSHVRGQWTITSMTAAELQQQGEVATATAPAADTGLSAEVWDALPEEAKARITALSTQLENKRSAVTRLERGVTRLQNQIDREREAVTLANAAKDAAIRAQADAEQKTNRLKTRNDVLRRMLANTNMIRNTAVIWRDATKGSAAKLGAFKNFCEALDSLPPEQELDTDTDFPLAG